ncbi:MAG TPA: hypothetical protein VIO86_05175 [Candidatus Dormibacteraeota bacterium]|jgi:hypothetical protein
MDSSAAGPAEVVAPAGALLDGENPTTIHRDDPEHWVAVYAELIESTKEILAASRERLALHSAADRADLKLLEREISVLVARSEFFADRLRWWADRGRELWAEED